MSVPVRGAACALLLAAASVASAQAPADPCLRCDRLYASDCNAGLWIIDPATATSTYVGSTSDVLFDIAITADGRLIGGNADGNLVLVSACDASATVLPWPSGGNALGSDFDTTDLFGQGPPLVRLDSDGAAAPVVVGGTIGPAAPDWCGTSAGDLALSPVDRMLRTALECPACPGDATSLQILDPATGLAVADARCIVDARGAGFESVYGLAFESDGRFWGVQAILAPRLLTIDPDTGLAEALPVTGGFTCGFGLACLPCGVQPDPCTLTLPPPPGIGAALRVTEHGDPYAADITARLGWALDEGAPRPANVHFHVLRGTDPRALGLVTDPEPLRATNLAESTPTGGGRRLVHYYLVRAADECERESLD
jgi:hypothetical protein